jgi:hypothetical protein
MSQVKGMKTEVIVAGSATKPGRYGKDGDQPCLFAISAFITIKHRDAYLE